MHAVTALCYFCENHGPRVVMTCQPMRNNRSYKRNTSDEDMQTDDEDCRFYGDIDTQDDVIEDEEERCEACSSFGSGLGILSNDHEAETSYVTTQMPMNDKLCKIVKQACLRSLSVEISTPLYIETGSSNEYSKSHSLPTNNKYSSTMDSLAKNFTLQSEKDGVVLFGDDENGYTLSHTFKLKDAKARGFHRSYSLIVISRDKLMLLNNYEFFICGFSAIVSQLHLMAKSFFLMEQELDSDLKLTQNVNPRGAPLLSHRFYPKQFNLDTSRSLTVITNNRDIFTILHRQMLYLLKTQTTLEQDTVLEGVPTQDMLVLMEMDKNTLEENDLVTSLSAKHTLCYLYNLRVISNRFITNQIKTQNPNGEINGHLLLINLLWQVVVGGQIIVKSDFVNARKLFLLSLINLIPVGCIRLASNSPGYIYNYKFNYLGCPLNTEIPEEVQGEIFSICLFPKTLPNYLGVNKQNFDYFADDLDDFDIFIEFCPSREGPKPALLIRYMDLLLDKEVNLSTLESALRATRSDWLNNAKLIFQLRHQKEGIDINKIIRIIKCGAQDSPVLLFWQSGLSRRYRQVVLNTINSNSKSI